MARLWLDTSVFTVALQNHEHSDACRELLSAVEQGTVQAVVDPVVLCELAYMLVKPTFVPPHMPARTPREVAEFLISLAGWSGLAIVERDIVVSALQSWQRGQSDDLVDAYLHARAAASGDVVCTVNRRHFPGSTHPRDVAAGSPDPRRRRGQAQR